MHQPLDGNRVKKRRTWPVTVRRLQDGDATRAMDGNSPQERIAAVAELTHQSWSLAGLDVPDYSRRATPVKVISRSDLAQARQAR